MTQEEIEALMNGADDNAFLSQENPDYGNDEFKDLVINYEDNDGNLSEFNNLISYSGNNPQEIYNYYKLLLRRNVEKIKKERDHIIKLQDFIKNLKKVMDENPEILI
jgi:hypothetical protein